MELSFKALKIKVERALQDNRNQYGVLKLHGKIREFCGASGTDFESMHEQRSVLENFADIATEELHYQNSPFLHIVTTKKF